MMQKMYIIQTSVALLVSSSSLHWESLAISLKSSLIGSDKLFLCVLISTIIIYLNSSQVEGGKILKECQYNCSQIPSLLSQFKTIQASYLFFNTFFFPWLLSYERPRQTAKPGKMKEPSGWNSCMVHWVHCDLWWDKDRHDKLSAVATSRYFPDHPCSDKDRGIFKL